MPVFTNNDLEERIHFHITSWYDEVEDFDNAKVGLVNYSNTAWQLSSYIPLASATFIYVGCGRAIYTLDLSKTAVAPSGFENQVEVLVCNYGPVDRTASQQLYTLGRPGLCPLGTLLSDRYPSLCRTIQDSPFRGKLSRRSQVRNKQQISNRTSPTVYIISLSQLLLFCTISLYLTVRLLLYRR
ncbi:uncharacterized protein [Mycetomoellerius zeteki]|uniref:uncharacterized protein n=1 Tax=Mycetomoellerius zeteki TaxID=64791 RepID=UPI00084E5B7C|nr:PREDICTED: uncharacterized protein LOC108727681 [Trachymyrmex zeteki]